MSIVRHLGRLYHAEFDLCSLLKPLCVEISCVYPHFNHSPGFLIFSVGSDLLDRKPIRRMVMVIETRSIISYGSSIFVFQPSLFLLELLQLSEFILDLREI